MLRSAIANAQQKDGFSGDVDRLYRVGVLRQPGAVAEARASGADGPRVPRAEAHGAPHGARVGAAARRSSRSATPAARGAEAAPRAARREEAGSRQRRRRAATRRRRRSNCGPEGSSVRVPARVQQDLAVALVLGPRLREAAARGSGAARDAEEALRARRRLEDRDRARGQQAEDRHLHLAARASSSAARARRSTS